MSTLSGIVSKGEKGKSKFQSLDINSLYRVSRGESLEPHQQKNTLPRKHGMQSLGKVPSARRPPANLPSLKSETSSSDPAVSLVPSGGSGWATTKDSTSSTTTTTTVATSSDNTVTVSSTAQCAAGNTVSTSLHSLLPGQQNVSQSPFLDQTNNKSSWSAIMSRLEDAVVGYAGLVGGAKGTRGALGLSFLAHQSPQFQHEFPSLSGQPSASVSTQSQTQQSSTTSNAISVAVHHSLLQQQPYSHNHSGGMPGNQQQSNRELSAQYGPGLSLRPQTEGSWIQGGSRMASGAAPATSAGPGNGNTPGGQGLPLNIPVSGGHTQEGPGGGRQNLGQSPNMGAGPAGQHNSVNNQGSAPSSGTHQVGPNLHHFRGLIPPFMYRSNFPGGFPPQFSSNSGSNSPRPRFNHPLDRFPPPQRDRVTEEEILTRPIIKEEDLTRMDDISHDAGWAAHDDIDYNQKLAFSDDESESEPLKNDEKKEFKEKKGDNNAAEEKEKSRDNPRDSKELRDPSHRPWTQPSMNRDYRGSNGASGSSGYNNQSQLHSVHSLRGVEDDETWNERRRIKVEVAFVIERARLRKEEEEKRFQESTKQAAAKKLQDLEQKMKEKQAKHKDEERTQSSESKSLISIPPVPLPIPEWEREKENRERERSRTSSEGKDEKIIASGRDNLARESRNQALADFRQNDRQTFLRQQDTVRSERERERDRNRDQRDSRDREQPGFSRHFQNNLPPRFQKQQAERSSANFNRISPNAESRQIERGDNSPKAWVDAISPTFEKEEEKIAEAAKEGQENDEIKQSLLDKPTLEKREEAITEDVKEQVKDEKREKNTRNRTSSGSSSSRVRESRGGRQWGGTFSVFTRWRGPESRGRRGGPRSTAGKSGMSAGSYGHTDSENSADEVSGSTESEKEDKRSARSPKPSQKVEKEERNREVSRRDDKRGTETYSQARSEKRGYDGKPSHEAFAPSGEPSRRGRGGGFRIRNTATGSRMEGYGPPSSKSPFSSERNADEKHQQNAGRQNPPTPTSEKEANLLQSAPVESTDDKIIAKQQALTAGITGRRNKSPSQQTQQPANKQETNQVTNVLSQKAQIRKEESRSKRTRSGSRRGRDNREARSRGSSSNVSKQPQSDVGNEDWETTSENSEEHIEDHKESRNSSRNKHFGGRAIQATNQNAIGANPHSRRNEQSATNTREQREKNPKSSNPASRAPGAEKRNLQNAGFGAQKNHNTDGIPPLMQNTQIQNGGRSRSQSSTNSGAISNKSNNKDSMVNRIDEIKLADPNLVNQALNDLNKKSQTKDKKLMDSEMETNSCTEDAANAAAEDKVDADGFQEVRSKKNVKESRHNQKEEAKPVKRDKEKDRDRERDRSKSKSNGSQQVLQQQIQNIPPLLGQNIPQPANIPQKREYDNRNSRNPRLAPRFQRLVKQQQQQMCATDASDMNKLNSSGNNYAKDSSNNPAPPPAVNAWDKPFTSQLRSNSPSAVPTDIQLMSSLTTQNDHSHEGNEANSGHSSQRNSPSGEKTVKNLKETLTEKNVVSDVSSPPVQTLIFENTNYSKTTKTTGPTDLAVKSKFSNHIKTQQQRAEKRAEMEEEGNSQVQQHPQQPALSVAFPNKPNDLIKDKNQEPIQMPLSFNKNEDNADMKLDFTFDSDLSQLTEDKSKSLGMPRSMHMTGGQSTISPSTAELNLKIASVKKVWENAPPMPTVVEHEDGSGVVGSATSFPQAFESGDVDDSYSPHQQYNQNNMKSEITTSTNVCKLVPPQVKPQQQSSGGSGTQPGSTVPGPSPIGAGQSPIGHPPVSLQGPLSPPPFNSTGQPSHINYQEFPQYPGSQAAQYGGMSAIPSPPAVLFNTGSGQLPAQAGGLYGAFQLDQSRSPFTQYAPYAPSLQSSFSQQNVYLQQPPPPPPHAPNAPTPEMYQNNLSQYRITAAAAPPFGQNQQLSNNPNTVLISSSSNSLMSASVKPSSQPIGAIGTKAPHFQTQSAPQPNQLAYIPYDPNQVLGVSGSYLNNSQLVQRPGPNVQASANSYYSATSADVFPGSQTGFYQSGGATQQTGTHYGLQGFGQHNQSLATGNATPVGLQNYGPSFLSSSGLQIAAAAQQFRNPTGGLPGPGNAAPTFLSKHQPQEQPRQLKSPSGNQQDVLASVFGSTSQIPSPKSRNCKQQSSSQQPQPSPTQHHKYQQYQGVSQSALVSSYNNYNVRGMGMPPRAGIQPSQQRYPPPIQRPVVPFAPGPNPNNPTQQQPACMPTQQQQQAQINRHRPNLHQQQQQQQRNMKMQQQYYSSQGNVKMDSNDKADNHNDKLNDGPSGTQPVGNKSNVNQQDSDNNKEEVNQQNE
ncbi:protein PRRC2C isoform X5 [Formica exsecta]|uniref:protein PRRC2C isoform X4 n=1 Tax=Formica exsecta TaxID=72781 RepID=UPI001141CB7B|nr:protein PRRC2C isoform X4 [Formica exsecta]XP_029661451.1 protein PRRC2C isoform X5 [Formica exsecta]